MVSSLQHTQPLGCCRFLPYDGPLLKTRHYLAWSLHNVWVPFAVVVSLLRVILEEQRMVKKCLWKWVYQAALDRTR